MSLWYKLVGFVLVVIGAFEGNDQLRASYFIIGVLWFVLAEITYIAQLLERREKREEDLSDNRSHAR